MDLNDVWNSVTYIRDEEEHIVAVEVPIDHWRFLMNRMQEMEDKEAARQRLAKLRGQTPSPPPDDTP